MGKHRASVSTSIANPIRTGVQFVPSAAITEFIDAFIYDMDEKQYLAMAGLLLMLISYGQNFVENQRGRGFLREVTRPVAKGDVVPEVDAP